MSAAHPFEDTLTTRVDSPRLSHTQRSRLVKSTRKLANILGENPIPQVNRPSSPWKKSWESNKPVLGSPIFSIAKKLARAALDPLQTVYRRDPDTNNEDIYVIKPDSGEMNTLSRGRNWSSTLVLQAVTSRDSEFDGHGSDDSSQFPSPAESSFSKPPSSVISTSASTSTLFLPAEWEKSKEEREISHRRKRLSKLARHLGERIPPDLVLSNPGSVNPNSRSQRKRRFSLARTPPDLPIVPPLPVESPTSEQEMTPSLSSPSSVLDVSRPAVEKTVEVFESAGRTQPPANGYSGGIDHSDAILFEGKEPEIGSPMVSPGRPESCLAFLRFRPASPPPAPAPDVVLHRSERRQGWSGEWNVSSMQDVISGLRDL
jgi:hypothetical protein